MNCVKVPWPLPNLWCYMTENWTNLLRGTPAVRGIALDFFCLGHFNAGICSRFLEQRICPACVVLIGRPGVGGCPAAITWRRCRVTPPDYNTPP